MATRKSKSAPEYVTQSLEDRLGALERRNKRTEVSRQWEKSAIRRICISLSIYVAACLMFLTMLIPGWYASALLPVGCYWLGLLSLNLAYSLWESQSPNRRKSR